MSSVKQILKEKYIEPNNKSNSTYMLTGTIIDVDEETYLCKVRYVNNKTGVNVIRDNVQVISYNKNIIDWFPEVNEEVNLQMRNNSLVIIGPAASAGKIRREIKLENDIFSDSFIDGIGGNLF